jgi:hypothetical protein
VEVEEHDRCLTPGLVDELVDELERGDGGLEEEIAEQVEHGHARPLAGGCDREASSRGPGREVRRPNHSVGAGEVGHDLAPPPDVVAEREHVDSRAEEPVRELRRDPDAVGRVLGVGDDEVEVELLAQALEPLLDRAQAGPAVDICDEEELQGVARLAAGCTSNDAWFPASWV